MRIARSQNSGEYVEGRMDHGLGLRVPSGDELPGEQAARKVHVAFANPLVDLRSASDFQNHHQHQSIFDPIDYAMVSDPDSVQTVVPTQLLAAVRSGIDRQRIDLLDDLSKDATVKLLQLASGCWADSTR
jgi:hypothetical protein